MILDLFSLATLEKIQYINLVACIILIIFFHILTRWNPKVTWYVMPIMIWAYELSIFYIARFLSNSGLFVKPDPYFFTVLSSLIRLQLSVSLAIVLGYILSRGKSWIITV